VNVLDALVDAGFVVVPGPVAPDALPRLAAAYDSAMASGDAAGLKVGSTTTRRHALVDLGAEFDGIYLHPPLLEACRRVVGESFRLSSMLGRTLRPSMGAQELHVDIRRDSDERPLLGFILMVDEFRDDNGATRFVPGSHLWREIPADVMDDPRAEYEHEVLACGPAGSMILFDGSVWHGHAANSSTEPRRSIQGYFVRREVRAATDFGAHIRPETLTRLGTLARHLLSL
jgi:Phytanoyl-CoA dioxygenase (PhyH)